MVFAWDCRHFCTLEASQESLKKPKKAPKRHPKSSKTPKKGIQNWTQKLTNVGPILGPKMGPKMGPRTAPKRYQKLDQSILLLLFMKHLTIMFWNLSGALLTPILEPHFGTRFAQEAAKMSPRGPSGASKPKNSLFKTLKKTYSFFNIFGSRDLPREPQEAQECSQEAPKELQNLEKKLKINSKSTRLSGRKCLSPAISI